MTPVDPRAIEAAARAEYEHVENDTWDQAHPDDRADWLESARVALEAAQGIMWAQALRDYRARLIDEYMIEQEQNMQEITDDLEARAHQLDPQ